MPEKIVIKVIYILKYFEKSYLIHPLLQLFFPFSTIILCFYTLNLSFFDDFCDHHLF